MNEERNKLPELNEKERNQMIIGFSVTIMLTILISGGSIVLAKNLLFHFFEIKLDFLVVLIFAVFYSHLVNFGIGRLYKLKDNLENKNN